MPETPLPVGNPTTDPNLDSQDAYGQGQIAQAQLADVNRQITAQPWYQSWLQAHGGGKNLSQSDKDNLAATIRAHGYQLPPNTEISKNATVAPIDNTARNLALVAAFIAPAIIGGIAGAGGAAAALPAGVTQEGTIASLGPAVGEGVADVGAGAAAPAAGLAGIEGGAAGLDSAALANLGGAATPAVEAGVAPLASTTTSALGALPAAVAPSGAVPAATAAGAGGGFLSTLAASPGSWLPSVISGAAQLGGAAIQSNATTEAAKIQAQTAANALAYVKSQAALEQANFAPYLAAGTKALGYMTPGGPAINPSSPVHPTSPSTYVPGAPGTYQPGSPNDPNKGATVTMQAPTGETQAVPSQLVDHYRSLGAVPVGA